LLDDSGVHHDQSVGHGERFVLVVGDEDEGDADFALDAFELELHRLPQLQVQCGQGLVEQQCARPVDQRAGEGNPLLLTAGKLPRPARRLLVQLHQFEHRVDPLGELALVHALATQTESDIVEDRHVGEQRVGLEDHVHVAVVRRHPDHVPAVKQDLSLGGLLETPDHSQRRRLAAPGRAEQ
jgi:hypothetical protein